MPKYYAEKLRQLPVDSSDVDSSDIEQQFVYARRIIEKAKENIAKRDKKIKEEYDRIVALGDNPFRYELDQKVQFDLITEKRVTKQSKL